MKEAIQNNVEMVCGIHFGKIQDGNVVPKEGERAECIISKNQSDKELIADMVASDFLCQLREYVVIRSGSSIHIHHKFNGEVGGIALVLVYKEDFVPVDWKKLRIFKEIDSTYESAEEKLEALTNAGFELEEIVDFALLVG